VYLVEENITERHLFGIEICDYLFKIKLVVYLAKPIFSSTVVVYLAIFVVYLAKPFLYVIGLYLKTFKSLQLL